MTRDELLATCSGGIIMSAESVRATRDGRKTQTRRVLKGVPDWCERAGFTCFTPAGHVSFRGNYKDQGPAEKFMKMRYQPGKRYYVKEAIKLTQSDRPDYDRAEYESDGAVTKLDTWPWKKYRLSGMVMPRGLARYVIEVDTVRVQRLQDITEEDARAEGFETIRDDYERCMDTHPKAQYAKAWDAINGRKHPWASNPWVWAITYRLVKP